MGRERERKEGERERKREKWREREEGERELEKERERRRKTRSQKEVCTFIGPHFYSWLVSGNREVRYRAKQKLKGQVITSGEKYKRDRERGGKRDRKRKRGRRGRKATVRDGCPDTALARFPDSSTLFVYLQEKRSGRLTEMHANPSYPYLPNRFPPFPILSTYVCW